MNCVVLPWEFAQEILGAVRRSGQISLQDALTRFSPEGIGQTVVARAALTERITAEVNRGTTMDLAQASAAFNEEWVVELMQNALRNAIARDNPARRNPRTVIRWIYELALSPRPSDKGVIASFQQAGNAADRAALREAQGTFFVWQFLDDYRFWQTVEDLEVKAPNRDRWYDSALAHLKIECKDWSAPAERMETWLVGGGPGNQLVGDLSEGPLDDLLWVFSERMSIPRERFYTWLDDVVQEVFDARRTGHPLSAQVPAAEANWAALRSRGLERRIILHDPNAARALVEGGSVSDDVLHREVQNLLRDIIGSVRE